jgi:hypothetical protein
MEAMGRDRDEFAEALFGGMAERRFRCLVAGLDEVVGRLREHITTSRNGGAP